MQMILKSLFIGTYPVLALALFAAPFAAGQPPIWLTLLTLAAALPFPYFLANLFLFPRARTSPNLSYLFIIPVLMLMISLIGLIVSPQVLADVQISISAIGIALIGNLAYVFWYSVFGDRNHSLLEVGKTLPEFSLADAQGNIVTSQDMSKQPSLIMFYRGNWCPLCMAQIKEVAEQYRELEARGIKIYMVSPQSGGHTNSLAKRFDVNMNFLIDENNKAADTLQIKAENGLPMGLQALGYDSDTVMPTVVMTNAQGKIIFADLTDNYRVRPEPEDFLKVFDGQLTSA